MLPLNTGSYVIRSNVNLKPYPTSGFAHNGVVDTKIGSIPWARARLRLEPDAATGKKDTRNGVIQRSFGTVRFGFIFYKNQSAQTQGKQLIGCENDDMAKLINALEGVDNYASDGLDFTQVYPYEGTPTGEAVLEAYDYLNQNNNYTGPDNSSFIAKGTLKDPYYGADASGAAKPVPCRKSFVLVPFRRSLERRTRPGKGSPQDTYGGLAAGCFQPCPGRGSER